ncbi:hypothetical protein ACH5RR_011609 [Cinchona calisaya]|uniref:PB1 domain-containing protein n=1 Tax=Cinchona calisaya TaxID=153742 RepID=A0ABD3AB97_9GENT
MAHEAWRIKAAADYKVRLMCSYGGKIQPRPHSNKLMYVGGDTKLITVDRNIEFSDIVKRLYSMCSFFKTDDVCIKYRLAGEDLDVLVSLIDHEDLENMMLEYDRLYQILSPKKPVRMRLFLFSVEQHPKPTSSSHHSGSDAPSNPDYLFGFDKDYDHHRRPVTPKKSSFDLELWKIPCTGRDKRVAAINAYNSSYVNGNQAHEVMSREGHVTGGVPRQQLAYHLPPMLPLGWQGKQGMVKIGMMNGNFWERPIYNFVPSIPSVPEQMKGGDKS